MRSWEGDGHINKLVIFGLLLNLKIINVRKAPPTKRLDASVNRLEAGFALRQRLLMDTLITQDVFLVRCQFGL